MIRKRRFMSMIDKLQEIILPLHVVELYLSTIQMKQTSIPYKKLTPFFRRQLFGGCSVKSSQMIESCESALRQISYLQIDDRHSCHIAQGP